MPDLLGRRARFRAEGYRTIAAGAPPVAARWRAVDRCTATPRSAATHERIDHRDVAQYLSAAPRPRCCALRLSQVPNGRRRGAAPRRQRERSRRHHGAGQRPLNPSEQRSR